MMMALIQQICEFIFTGNSVYLHCVSISPRRFPTRREVDGANSRRLAQLTTEPQTYSAIDTPGWDEQKEEYIPLDVMEKLVERLVAPKSVTLKVGDTLYTLVPVLKYLHAGRRASHADYSESPWLSASESTPTDIEPCARRTGQWLGG